MSSLLPHVDGAHTRSLGPTAAGRVSAALNVGFVLLDAHGAVSDATPMARDLFSVRDLEAFSARWSSLQADLAPVITATRPEAPREIDVRYDADGVSRSVRCEFHALEGNDRAGYVVLVQALDRAVALDAALRLASRYQTLSAIQPTAVHDFKGSLNALSLHTAVLEHTLGDGAAAGTDPGQMRCVQALQSELERLERGIGTVLNEHRADEAGVVRVDLGTLLESVAALLGAHAKRQGVTITRIPARAWVEVTGHADSLQQVILNLATNALEAMRDGGTLRLELATDGDDAVLTVSDTGAGIPSELQQQIWDFSFSTKPLGHGIGLHVAKRVVLAHGGHVDLRSSTEGTSFVVRLPLAR